MGAIARRQSVAFPARNRPSSRFRRGSGTARRDRPHQPGDQPARPCLPCQLLVGALPRRLVRPPAKEPRAMPEPSPRDLVVADLHDQLRPQGTPLTRALGAPAARATGCPAREPRPAPQLPQAPRQRLALPLGNRGGEPHVIEKPLVIEKSEEQRPDLLTVGRQPIAADDE